MTRHVVWDWNGTLFDDLPLIVRAANASLVALGGEPISMERYRTTFRRPIREFYAELLGRPLDDTAWEVVDEVFHDTYDTLAEHADLAVDARAALDRVSEAGVVQSLLSMWHHERLLLQLDRLGITTHFVRVDGRRGEGGGSKLPFLEAHLEELLAHHAELAPTDVLVIGDTLDDAGAAAHVGTRCVLYAGGEHGPDALAATGFPVARSLMEALTLGGVR